MDSLANYGSDDDYEDSSDEQQKVMSYILLFDSIDFLI